jgi:hypothetical protein
MIGATILSLYKEPVQSKLYLLLRNLAPTKHAKVLVCYDFHSRIYDEKEDLMFITEPRLLSIGTIVVLTLVWLDQLVKLIPSASLNLVEQGYVHVEPIIVLPISSHIHVELVFVLHVQIVIPLNTFSNKIYQRFFSNLK